MEKKGVKALTNLLSKTAGLIFFSFLAISLGVVFGLLFEGWVKDQPGTPVGTETTNLETIDLPVDNIDNLKKVENSITPKGNETTSKNPIVPVKFKVRVGPYNSRNEALSASQQLQSLGYPVYVGINPPFAVQVGAFGSQGNAEKLMSELKAKGYKSFIEQN